ncbi:MAG: hypothetical protein HY074_18335 [Deltaproteobacteria bacterium]|nr:hypothetical protein [Deltaproteobacteria bacterium]
MQKRSVTVHLFTLCQIIVVGFIAWGCSGRKVDMDTSASSAAAGSPNSKDEPQRDPKDLKIDNLTSALSRAQSRIEELDAKVSALADKVDATRLTVDNVVGNKPIKTESVGSARDENIAESKAEAKAALEEKKSAARIKSAAGKALSTMDNAINEFNKAMAVFKAGKFADAELAFTHFTEGYPEHILAGSGQFYAGESYFMMGEYKLALNEYQKVISSFGTSPRVASAMVRMAHCYDAVGNAGESSRTMALAHDLYEGNPSLDWPSAGKKSAKADAHSSNALNLSPIEPTGKTEAKDKED